MPKYEVPIIYHGQANFIVDADDDGAAEEQAIELFESGDPGVALGNEWEEYNRTGVITKLPEN